MVIRFVVVRMGLLTCRWIFCTLSPEFSIDPLSVVQCHGELPAALPRAKGAKHAQRVMSLDVGGQRGLVRGWVGWLGSKAWRAGETGIAAGRCGTVLAEKPRTVPAVVAASGSAVCLSACLPCLRYLTFHPACPPMPPSRMVACFACSVIDKLMNRCRRISR